MLPRPPNRLVPPITTAVMLSRFAVCNAFGSALGMRPRESHAPMPYRKAQLMELMLADSLRKRGYLVFGGH